MIDTAREGWGRCLRCVNFVRAIPPYYYSLGVIVGVTALLNFIQETVLNPKYLGNWVAVACFLLFYHGKVNDCLYYARRTPDAMMKTYLIVLVFASLVLYTPIYVWFSLEKDKSNLIPIISGHVLSTVFWFSIRNVSSYFPVRNEIDDIPSPETV